MVHIVYVKLLNEGVDVWRPVKAEKVEENIYRLSERIIPDGEEWEFPPGSLVYVKTELHEGKESLIAVSKAFSH